MTTPADKLAELRHFIEETRRKLDTGEELELIGLDKIVGALCKDILALPPDQAQKYVADMQTLLGALNSLQAELINKQGSMQQQLEGLNMQKKAAAAYLTSKTLAPKIKKPEDGEPE